MCISPVKCFTAENEEGNIPVCSHLLGDASIYGGGVYPCQETEQQS